jgi:hypothetical protein
LVGAFSLSEQFETKGQKQKAPLAKTLSAQREATSFGFKTRTKTKDFLCVLCGFARNASDVGFASSVQGEAALKQGERAEQREKSSE